jgi:hypothetical protein
MKKTGTKRARVLTLAIWAVVSWQTPLAGAAVGHADASESGTISCDAKVDCGAGCWAEFTHGFCVQAFEWEGGFRIGSVQLAPSISAECSVCECWYAYVNADGNRLLKRSTSLRCSGGFPGVETYE